MGVILTGRAIGLVALLTGTAAAADPYLGSWGGQPTLRPSQGMSYASADDTVRLDASIGAAYIEGSEKVLVGNYTLSHLIWQSVTPVLRGSISVDVGGGFNVRAEGSVAAFGRSYMEDYDWQKGDNTFDNWSHRSQHPDTNLDHFYTGGASLGYEIVKDDTAVVRAHGGFKYTDVKWSAYGGSYVYSSNGGFRDVSGSIADGTPGISYRQQFPELFLGIDGEERYGDVRVGGLLRGGMTFLSVSTDDHWLRNLRFVDTLRIAPTFTAGMDVGYALGRNAELTISARYDHIFEARGDTQYYNIASGASTGNATDAAGGGMRSAEITTGLHGSF